MVRWAATRSESEEEVEREESGAKRQAEEGEGRWERMLPEILGEIVRRVDAGGERWPQRKDIVAYAGVCRRWRDAAWGIVRQLRETGSITFPSSLKEVPFVFFFDSMLVR